MNDSEKYVKYPRTVHLPWSEGVGEDDITIDTAAHFEGKEVVVTEKMDGENTTMYNDHVHARSINSGYHPSRTRVKALQAEIGHRLGDNQRLCGENLFWVHSIVYTALPSYFLMFSFWEDDLCFSWDDTLKIAEKLKLYTVPVLYRGMYDEDVIKALYDENKYNNVEGYVVRLASSFKMEDFKTSVAKFVRNNHVQTSGHWLRTGGELNMLKVEKS